MACYLGVHIDSGKKPYVLAVYYGGQRLELLENMTLEGVLVWAAAEEDACMAINAPSCLNQGLLANPDLLPPGLPIPSEAQLCQMRLVEYELNKSGLPVGSTPGELQKCPRWMRRGFTLYDRLGELGYLSCPAPEAGRQWLEVRADAAFQRLLKCTPYRARTLEGQLQRQVLLHEIGMPVSDPMYFLEEITRYRLLHGLLPMDTLYSHGELNALLSAYVAYLAHRMPDRVMRYGAAEEGVVTLPV